MVMVVGGPTLPYRITTRPSVFSLAPTTANSNHLHPPSFNLAPSGLFFSPQHLHSLWFFSFFAFPVSSLIMFIG